MSAHCLRVSTAKGPARAFDAIVLTDGNSHTVSPSAGSPRVYSCAITEPFSHTDDKEAKLLFFKVHGGMQVHIAATPHRSTCQMRLCQPAPILIKEITEGSRQYVRVMRMIPEILSK